MACVLVEWSPYPVCGAGTFRAYHCAAPILNTQPERVAIPHAKRLWVCAMEEYSTKCRNPRHLFPPGQHATLTQCPRDPKAKNAPPMSSATMASPNFLKTHPSAAAFRRTL